jgi:hypothetical protein
MLDTNYDEEFGISSLETGANGDRGFESRQDLSFLGLCSL